MDNEKLCDGVVECTALVLAESCAELDGRLTLFGILDELRPGGEEGLLWVEAELDEETLAQTAIPLRERYNV